MRDVDPEMEKDEEDMVIKSHWPGYDKYDTYDFFDPFWSKYAVLLKYVHIKMKPIV